MVKNIVSLVSIERIQEAILLIRGQKVMLDADLARIYGVATKRLNEQVKRNIRRFPDADFMFQLTDIEKAELVANCDRFKNMKHSTVLPYVFTEHGAVMLANVLNSDTAIEASVQVVKTFIKMRAMLSQNADLSRRLARVDQRVSKHDEDIRNLIDAIHQLMAPPKKSVRQIGFKVGDRDE